MKDLKTASLWERTYTQTDPRTPLEVHMRLPDSMSRELRDSIRYPQFDLDTYPVLSRALENEERTYGLKVEWLEDYNWLQIFRSPFLYRLDGSDFAEKSDAAAQRLLLDLETTLTYGQRLRSEHSHMMGGFQFFLARDLLDSDYVGLRTLCPLTLHLLRGTNVTGTGIFYNDGEWLMETSLVVYPNPKEKK